MSAYVCNVYCRTESGSEPDAAILEEQEALAIQKRMAEQLDDQDVGFDFFKVYIYDIKFVLITVKITIIL